MQPKVTLVSHTPNPVETLWILWEQSKVDGAVPMTVDEVNATVPKDKQIKLFWDVINQHIPVGEHLHFAFVIEGVSISWREQAVRHRIGTRVGDRLGIDIIPDIADSSWWSQSMRIQDMSGFADREAYRMPDTLEGKVIALGIDGQPATEPLPDGYEPVSKVSAQALYEATMRQIQGAYKALVAAGVPMEDARELIPLGATHRLSWDLNLQAIGHIVGKRGCWILQAGIWAPIIEGMINEMAAKVHPMFRALIRPPCIGKDDKFKACAYQEENRRRMPDDAGVVHDQLPPCPLWLCRDKGGGVAALESHLERQQKPIPLTVGQRRSLLILVDDLIPRQHEMNKRTEQYAKLWGHDPFVWDKDMEL